MSEYDDRYSELEELLLTQYSEEEADKINEAYKFAKKEVQKTGKMILI